VSNKYFLSGLFFRHEIFTDDHPDYIGFNLPRLKHINLNSVVDYYQKNIKDNAVIYAWSMAGLFAIALKIQYPQKINKLYLLGASPCFCETTNWSGISQQAISDLILSFHKTPQNTCKKFAWLCAYPDVNEAKNISQFIVLDDCYLSYLALLRTLDLRSEYQQLDESTTVILGSDDVMMKTVKADFIHLNARVNVIEKKGIGHADLLRKTED